MSNLFHLIRVELKKVIRSRMPLWTTLGAIVMPIGEGLLIFAAKQPEILKNVGLLSAKANLVEYAATDWTSYFILSGETIAAGGFFLFILAVSWIFGREFVDGTLKDMLAVPVPRFIILLAKFLVVVIWSAELTVVMLAVNLVMGALIHLPGGSSQVILHGSSVVLITAALVIAASLPFAFFASIGRGYLLAIGLAILAVVLANFVAVAGWGDYFPWAVPGVFVQEQSTLAPVSYWIVIFTCLAGILATHLWWKYADQSR
jgi:ABC-2 type transport system permease protein